VTSLEPSESVVPYHGGVATALRLERRATEAECSPDVEEGQSGCNGRSGRHSHIEIGGVEQAIGSEGEVNAVEAQTNGVGQIGREDVIFAKSEKLAETVASVAETRDSSANQAAGSRFLAQILLQDVVAVKTVFIGEIVVHVTGALIQGDIRNCRAGEAVEGGGVRGIAGADQIGGRN